MYHDHNIFVFEFINDCFCDMPFLFLPKIISNINNARIEQKYVIEQSSDL